MSKLEQLKNAIKNPPPERLASIEYKSHLLQAIGITFVCLVLIYKGFWYIIFALIFGVGVSYTQGISAYTKYKMIMSMKPEEKLSEIDKDISWTRRRGKIVNHAFGKWSKQAVIIGAVLVAVKIIPVTLSRWKLMFLYPSIISVVFMSVYYHVLYWIAKPFYLNDLKGGEKHGKNKKRNTDGD